MLDDPLPETKQEPKSLRSQYPTEPRRLFALLCKVACLGLYICFTVSCGNPSLEREKLGIDMDTAYMMLTREVDMLISDSGLTRYRMTAPLWLIYDRPDRKEWVFSQGLEMWSVDSVQPGNELVTADTAYYFTDREEWLLIGNVRIHGLKGEKLYTPRLHWLRGQKRLYSDDTTYFATEGKELRGSRFEAADDLSEYTIYNNSANLLVQEQPMGADSIAPSSTPADTIKRR